MDTPSKFIEESPKEQHKIVHLCVDVQLGCIAGLETDAARRYLDGLGEGIDELRGKEVPTLWVAISEETRVLPGNGTADKTRNPDSRAMEPFTRTQGMATDDRAAANAGVFQEFLEQYGPKANEDILHKRTLDAFIDRKTLDDNPVLYEHLTNHLPDETPAKIDAALQGPSLAEHLKAQSTEHVLITGMDAFVCALETAVGAARNGLQVTVLTDGLACTGRGDSGDPTYAKSPDDYKARFMDILDKMVNDPKALADDGVFKAHAEHPVLTAQDKQRIVENIKFSTSKAFAASLDAGPTASSFLKSDASPAQPETTPRVTPQNRM